jgi:hypothetical protein
MCSDFICMSDEADIRLSQAIVDSIDLLTKFSVPLYREEPSGKPEQFGTGFFVRTEKHHYLVSAAHVLDESRVRGGFFYLAPNAVQTLTGRVITTGHPSERDNDLFDVGVIQLAKGQLPPYTEVDKFAMDYSYLSPRLLPRSTKHYAIIGFPASQSSTNPAARTTSVAAYAYRSDSLNDGEYAGHGFSPESHVLLPLDRKRGFGPDGRIRAFPKPQGMSGAPIIATTTRARVTSRECSRRWSWDPLSHACQDSYRNRREPCNGCDRTR